MLFLAFDTSTSKGGVAITENGQVLTSLVWEREGSHGELLTPAIEKCLEKSGRTLRDLDALALVHGPGSFTGVRIAVNAARTLGYALHKPVYAFDTAEALAASCPRRDLPLAILINAHKNLLFVSTFIWTNEWVRKTALSVMTLEVLTTSINETHLCVGDGFTEFDSVMSSSLKNLLVRDPILPDEPSPEALGLLAFRESSRASGRKPLDWKDVQALYIRASGAEEKLREDLGKKG
jgi:tRNA threonylcarbamoyladenosine biosynthesis protein TsaB